MDSGLFSGRLLGSGPAGGMPRSGVGDVTRRLGAVGADRAAQPVAAAPHGPDVVFAPGLGGHLPAPLADHNVAHLFLPPVPHPIEDVEGNLLFTRGSLV